MALEHARTIRSSAARLDRSESLAAVADLPAAAAISRQLAVLERAAAGLAGARLGLAQPEPLLEFAAGDLGAWPALCTLALLRPSAR